MTHEFKDVAGDTYLSIDASQPVIIGHQRPIEPDIHFLVGGTEPVLVISAVGKVTWNGREVVGDEEFKKAMMDLNVKLSGINKTIQPALSDDEILNCFYASKSEGMVSYMLAVGRAIEAHCRGGVDK